MNEADVSHGATGLCDKCLSPLDDHGHDGKVIMHINGQVVKAPGPALNCPVTCGPMLTP